MKSRSKRAVAVLAAVLGSISVFVAGFGLGAYEETRHRIYDGFRNARDVLLPPLPVRSASDTTGRRLETM